MKKKYILILSMLYGWFSTLSAQEASAATSVAREKSPIDYFLEGGWAMWPLLLLSISTVGLVVYNFMMVRRKVLAPAATVEQLKSMAAQLDMDGINQLCNSQYNPVTNIFSAGVARIHYNDFDPESISKAMDESSEEELSSPFSMINYLNIIAAISPMVGMLGTVSGMVKAFQAIAVSGGMADPGTLAANISEALITTASGLIIAIPAMFFFFVFKAKYSKIVARLGRELGDIYHILVLSVRNPEAAAAYAQPAAEGVEYEEEQQ